MNLDVQQQPTYSAVILTFNSERYIQRCLSDLVHAFKENNASYEIFIIDNGSKDRTIDIIEQFIASFQTNLETSETKVEASETKIELISYNYNTGTTFSRNQGLKRASGEFIIIMDSDAYCNTQTLKILSKHLQNKLNCGMAVPRLNYLDGRFQLSTDVFPTLKRKIERFFLLKKIEQRTTEEPTKIDHVDYAISAFWMFKNEILNTVGLLDEKIFYSPEDVDYCIRIWKAGYSIDYIPTVSVIHDAQEISRPKGFRINWFTLSHAKGLFYLFYKHRYIFSPPTIKHNRQNVTTK